MSAFLQIVDGQVFSIAAEHDIRTAAGHVRGDRHRTEFTGLRDNLRFFIVVLGVEDVMR